MYTIDELLKSPAIIGAVIDRARQTELDDNFWVPLLPFEETSHPLFKTLYGSVSAVRMGSVIDRGSQKPLRSREGLRHGVLEVATIGDRYQMDNNRLETLRRLVARLNEATNPDNVQEVTTFLVDDMRECLLAPYKRMEHVVGSLLATGAASVSLKNNPKGIHLVQDVEIPVVKAKATASAKGKLMAFLNETMTKNRKLGGQRMLMSRATFLKYFATNPELVATFKSKLGESEATVTGIISPQLIVALFGAMGLPTPIIVDNTVLVEGGSEPEYVIPEGKLSVVPAGELGKMRWYRTYEAIDKLPNVNYVERQGGHLISTERTREGRFMEYEANWIPEIKKATSILSIDIKASLA